MEPTPEKSEHNIDEFAGKSPTELSKTRTGFSEHRTHLSEHRTDLSEKRTGLSEHRTSLSEQRSELSEERTELSNLRSHLSNERTHLSFLRTGVALISFGITLNRFSLFLIQSNEMQEFSGRSLLHDTKNAGIGMVILGSALLAWSIRHFLETDKSIRTGVFKPMKWSVVFFTMIVFIVGTMSTVWMITG